MQTLQRSFDDIIAAGMDEVRLIKTMNLFKKVLINANITDRYVLKMNERIRILKFNEQIRKHYINNRNIMSARDSSFGNFLSLTINDFPNNLEKQTTVIFSRFMKGITYFNNTPVHGTPIYHRPSSCGPNPTLPSYEDENLKCLQEHFENNNNEELIRRRGNIKNCVMERIIYNNLYKYITTKPYQDFGHTIQYMQKLRVNFTECFRGTVDIEVNIEYHPEYNFIPIKLYVIIPSISKEIIEEYTRTIDSLPTTGNNFIVYNPTIHLRRVIKDFENNIEIYEEREQSEDGTVILLNENAKQYRGGYKITSKLSSKYILYNTKKYLIKIDKNNNKYIVSKCKIYLKEIKGKYKYIKN